MNSESFTFGSACLFLTPVWVELPSDSDTAVLLKPLSYATLGAIQDQLYLKQQNDKYFKFDTYQTILQEAIRDTRNFIDFPNAGSIVTQLPTSDLKYLYDSLIEISTMSFKQIEALDDMLTIQFSPQFRDDSWNCTTCQDRKLDYSRACGFLPENKRDPAPYLPKVGNKRFTQCPISTIDGYVTKQASLAYGFMEAGVMPETGGIGNQTDWFVKVAILYKKKVAEAERDALDAHKKNR